MERRVVLLGYGMQGKACVYDLIKNGDFSHLDIVDCYEGFLNDVEKLADSRIRGHHMDGDDHAGLMTLFAPATLVIDFFPPPFHPSHDGVGRGVRLPCHDLQLH